MVRIHQQENLKSSQENLPAHVGIIMDGNGRWAKKNMLPRKVGHTAGARNFRKITKYCSKKGIKHLTVFAFSTENWKRPHDEVFSLMKLFKQYLEEAISDFQSENIKVIFVGDTSVLDSNLQELIKKVETLSSSKDGMILNIAINYGGRSEIVRASKLLAQDVKENIISYNDITEKLFKSKLYTHDQPDIDLVIRPSGEHRISNFMLWQSAYAEYVIMDVLWPDFKTQDMDRALDIYSERTRRFGGI